MGARGRTISGASNSGSESIAAVSLIFSRGERPTAEAIHAHIERGGEFSVSHCPADDDEASAGNLRWLELLASGLTFDFSGLSPGPPAELPPRARSVAIDEDDNGFGEAVVLRPGPHLAEGEGMVPVARMMASLAASLSEIEGVWAVAWHPARCWSAPEVFRNGVVQWVEGGVFPGLILASLALSPDGGMQSEGLTLFTGQELRLEPEMSTDRAEAAKLAVRLLDFLVSRGRVDASETLAGPDGTPLRLEPSVNRRFVRVCRY